MDPVDFTAVEINCKNRFLQDVVWKAGFVAARRTGKEKFRYGVGISSGEKDLVAGSVNGWTAAPL